MVTEIIGTIADLLTIAATVVALIPRNDGDTE